MEHSVYQCVIAHRMLSPSQKFLTCLDTDSMSTAFTIAAHMHIKHKIFRAIAVFSDCKA